MLGRLALIVVVAAVAGGLAGAAIETALGGSSTAATTPLAGAATPEPVALGRPRSALSPEEIYRRDAPGVVVIVATATERIPRSFFSPPAEQQVRSLGSGFVVDGKGDVVTNDHVVQGASALRVGFTGGASYPAKLVGTDPSTDLAVVRLEAPEKALHPLRFGDSGRVVAGDPVYAIGNPFGLERTLTAGIVSAVGRDIRAPNGLSIDHAIQTDASINHGNSGGPLLDRFGRVIGINAQIESGGADTGNVGVGFAIPSDTARAVVPQLLAHGRAAHAWLGVEVQTIDPVIARVGKGLPSHGALAVRVVPGSPAAGAGLVGGHVPVTVNGESTQLGGDAIVSADGRRIFSSSQLADLVAAHRPGDMLELRVVRGGRERTVRVKLGNVPSGL